MFVLMRAVTYGTLFVGFLLVFLPGACWSGPACGGPHRWGSPRFWGSLSWC